VLANDFFEHVPDHGLATLDHALGALDVLAIWVSMSRFMTKGLKSSRAIILGRPHWWSLSWGPTTMTERPE